MKISLLKLCSNQHCNGEGRAASMRLFSKKGRAVKNWHARAMLIDTRRTKLTLISTSHVKHVPPWVYEKFAMS